MRSRKSAAMPNCGHASNHCPTDAVTPAIYKITNISWGTVASHRPIEKYLFQFGPHARLWSTTKPSNISQMLRYGNQRRVASFRVPSSDPLLQRGQYMFFRLAWKQHGGSKNLDHCRSERPNVHRPARHSLRHFGLPKLRWTIVRSNSSEWLNVISRCPVFLPFQCHTKIDKH